MKTINVIFLSLTALFLFSCAHPRYPNQVSTDIGKSFKGWINTFEVRDPMWVKSESDKDISPTYRRLTFSESNDEKGAFRSYTFSLTHKDECMLTLGKDGGYIYWKGYTEELCQQLMPQDDPAAETTTRYIIQTNQEDDTEILIQIQTIKKKPHGVIKSINLSLKNF